MLTTLALDVCAVEKVGLSLVLSCLWLLGYVIMASLAGAKNNADAKCATTVGRPLLKKRTSGLRLLLSRVASEYCTR